MKICSACLLGLNCRYNGKAKANHKALVLSRKEILIPVCPEQMGGLQTPREPAERVRDRVLTKSGINITKNFVNGAKEVLKVAKFFGAKEAIFKQGSPSCGCGKVYDGSFSGKLIKGDGITTSLLKKNGIKVITEENLK